MDLQGYKQSVKNDIEQFFNDAWDDTIKYLLGLRDRYDTMEVVHNLENTDEITGNMSGSYYFNSAKAREAVSDMIFDDDFNGWCDECGFNHGDIWDNPERADVFVRCFVMENYCYNFVDNLLDEYAEKLNYNGEDDVD